MTSFAGIRDALDVVSVSDATDVVGMLIDCL